MAKSYGSVEYNRLTEETISLRPKPAKQGTHCTPRLKWVGGIAAVVVIVIVIIAVAVSERDTGDGDNGNNPSPPTPPATTFFGWRHARASSFRDGVTTAGGPLTNPAFSWKQTGDAVGTTLWSTPIISGNGVIFVVEYGQGPDDKTTLWSLDPDMGTARWLRRINVTSAHPPVLSDDDKYLYYFDRISLGPVICMAYAVDGRQKWCYYIKTVQDFTIAGESLFVTADGLLFHIDSVSGQLLWKSSFTAAGSPAVDNDYVYVVSSNFKTMQAAARLTGQVIWSKTHNFTLGNPVVGVFDQTIYYTEIGDAINPGRLYAVAIASGKFRWTKTLKDVVGSDFAMDSTNIFLCIGSTLQSFSRQTGQFLWSFNTTTRCTTAPAVDQYGVLYVGSLENTLYALDTGLLNHLYVNQTVVPASWKMALASNTNPLMSSPAVGLKNTLVAAFGDVLTMIHGRPPPEVAVHSAFATPRRRLSRVRRSAIGSSASRGQNRV